MKDYQDIDLCLTNVYIGMSHFGVNANTWTVQVAHESQGAAKKDPRIAKFILLDAGFDQKK